MAKPSPSSTPADGVTPPASPSAHGPPRLPECPVPPAGRPPVGSACSRALPAAHSGPRGRILISPLTPDAVLGPVHMGLAPGEPVQAPLLPFTSLCGRGWVSSKFSRCKATAASQPSRELHVRSPSSGFPFSLWGQLSLISAFPLPSRVIVACYRPALLCLVPETILYIRLPCTDASVRILAPIGWTDIDLSLCVLLSSKPFGS